MLNLDFEKLDRDGAVREAAERLPGETRRDFLAKAAVGGGALLGAFAVTGSAAAASKNDLAILNYALTLEYIQASFYTDAERRKALKTRPTRQAARVLGAVERAHVRALKSVLGDAAVGRPFFDFQGTTEDEEAFLKTAVAFEDLGCAAYKGQAYRVDSRELLAAAVSIHSVEARHAAWIRYLAGVRPAAEALDEPRSMAEVRDLVASTKFIVSTPKTQGTGSPSFTG